MGWLNLVLYRIWRLWLFTVGLFWPPLLKSGLDWGKVSSVSWVDWRLEVAFVDIVPPRIHLADEWKCGQSYFACGFRQLFLATAISVSDEVEQPKSINVVGFWIDLIREPGWLRPWEIWKWRLWPRVLKRPFHRWLLATCRWLGLSLIHLPRFHRAKLKTGNFWWRLTVSANLVSLQEAQVLFETAFTDAGCTLAHDHGLQIIRGPNHRLEGSVLLGCERLAWDFVDLRFALSFS